MERGNAMKRVILVAVVLALVGGAYVVGQESGKDEVQRFGNIECRSISILSSTGKEGIRLDGDTILLSDSAGKKAIQLSAGPTFRNIVIFDLEGNASSLSMSVNKETRTLTLQSPLKAGIVMSVSDRAVTLRGHALSEPMQTVLPMAKK